MDAMVDMTDTVDMDVTPTLDAMETETPLPQVTEPADMVTGTPDAMHDEGEIHYVVLNIMQDTAQTQTTAQKYPYYGIEWDDFNISHGDDFTETGTQTGTGAQPGAQTATQTGFQTGVLLYQEDTIDLTNAVRIEDEWLETDDIFYRTSVDTGDVNTQPHMLAGLYRLSAFTQFRLFNPDLVNPGMDEDLGVVEDMIVNVDEGKVQYVVAEIGGWLGMGRTTVIIPWERVGYDEVEE